MKKISVYQYTCSVEIIKYYCPLFTSGDSNTQKVEVILYKPEGSKRNAQLKIPERLQLYLTHLLPQNSMVYLNFAGHFQEKAWAEIIFHNIHLGYFRDRMENLCWSTHSELPLSICKGDYHGMKKWGKEV